MEEKLRSILKRTHWSSVLKAVVFAGAWFLVSLGLPFWLFLIIALYLYLVPIAGADKVLAPFLVLMVLTLFEGPNAFFVLIFGVAFYYMLLIKDLLIIDRKPAYEILVLVLSYLLLRVFFMKEGGDFGGWSLFISLLVAGLFGMMLSSYINNFSLTGADGAILPEARSFYRTITGVSFLLHVAVVDRGTFPPTRFLLSVRGRFLDVHYNYRRHPELYLRRTLTPQSGCNRQWSFLPCW